jgi:hypothetical protein
MTTYNLKIFIHDTDQGCSECPCLTLYNNSGCGGDVCEAERRLLKNIYQRPDWCPLVEVKDV